VAPGSSSLTCHLPQALPPLAFPLRFLVVLCIGLPGAAFLLLADFSQYPFTAMGHEAASSGLGSVYLGDSTGGLQRVDLDTMLQSAVYKGSCGSIRRWGLYLVFFLFEKQMPCSSHLVCCIFVGVCVCVGGGGAGRLLTLAVGLMALLWTRVSVEQRVVEPCGFPGGCCGPGPLASSVQHGVLPNGQARRVPEAAPELLLACPRASLGPRRHSR
jgi:hypothetical protein